MNFGKMAVAECVLAEQLSLLNLSYLLVVEKKPENSNREPERGQHTTPVFKALIA